MPKFHISPADARRQTQQSVLQDKGGGEGDVGGFMDMFMKAAQMSQQQQNAPLNQDLLRSEAEKNRAAAGAETAAGHVHEAMLPGIQTKADLNDAKSEREFALAHPGGIENVKDYYSAAAGLDPNSHLYQSLHAYGDKDYLAHHDPMWHEIEAGRGTPEMAQSPYLNDGEKWTLAHGGAQAAPPARESVLTRAGNHLGDFTSWVRNATGLDKEVDGQLPVARSSMSIPEYDAKNLQGPPMPGTPTSSPAEALFKPILAQTPDEEFMNRPGIPIVNSVKDLWGAVTKNAQTKIPKILNH